ncbi:MAG: hypothetical protein JNK35_03960 [Phycisphaerae bacterium]|nr:hypothetical protein [Phycisphaerae bacterium]
MRVRHASRAFVLPATLAGLMALGGTMLLAQPQGPGNAQPRQPGGPGRGPGGEGQPGGPGRGPGGPGAEGRPVSVEQGMKQMNRVLRQLRQQIGDASKRDENLRMLTDMQRGCVGAKGAPLSPDMMKDAKDDAAKVKLAWEFRADMIAVLRLLVDAEEAVGLGKGEVAKSKLEEAIKLRDAGHKRMGISDE